MTVEAAALPIVPDIMADVAALPAQTFQGNGFQATYTNVGARIESVTIQRPEQYVPRDDFGGIFPQAEARLLPFGLTVEGLSGLNEDSAFEFVADASEVAFHDGDEPVYSRLVYRWSNGALEIDKVFTADSDLLYTTRFDLVFRDLTGSGQRVPESALHMWADDAEGETVGAFNPIANTQESVCFIGEELENFTRGKLDNDRPFPGRAHWSGVQDRYFLTAVVSHEGDAGTGCTLTADDTYIGATYEIDGVDVPAGGERSISLYTYTGPKDEDALTASHTYLTQSINYGLFTFLAIPMKWTLKAFWGLVGNWGLAIIFLTIVVRLLMFPMTQKAFKSMERMKEIQPLLTEVREKYEHDRTKMTEETMKLYKEHNVNPFGCLPMLLQIPIYIALYRTIYSSVELYKADFALWITDLSVADPYYILPVLMAVTMFGQQLLMPTTVDNPQMKWMMRVMPLMFGFFMLVLPSGLVLYIFISSLLGILQQWLIRRGRKKVKAQEEAALVVAEGNLTRQQRRQRARKQGST